MQLKSKIIMLLIPAVILFMALPVFALQAMNDGEMKQATAQAGFSVAVDNLIIENNTGSFKLSDPDDETNAIAFNEIKGLYTLSVGKTDTNNDSLVLPVHFDVGSVFDDEGNNGRIMAILSSGDWDQNGSFSIDEVNWAGTKVGQLEVTDFEMPCFQLMAGPHADPLNPSGIDFEFQTQSKIGEISYQYNDMQSKLKFEGIAIGESFTGDVLPNYVAGANPATPEDIDTSTWAVQGQMKFGDLSTNNPATFDVGTGGTATDKTVTSVVNLPMNGSMRIDKVEMGGQNFGPVAIDGIHVQKMVIEFPGRGLGKL